jgi:hypothetical protein
MDWIDLAQERYQWRALVNMVMNIRVPLNAGKFLRSCATGDFSRRAQRHGVSHYGFLPYITALWGVCKNGCLS